MLGVQKIGRYEVLSHLASGGMGQVYLARSTGLGGFERQVVVKTLDLSITDDDESFVTMFLDDARRVGALHHPYIAPVYEVGCDEDGCYYLVMDYVHGETTEAVYRAAAERLSTLPLAFALTVVSCVASALDYAHNLCAADGTPLDIVHRDISLSNVMVGYDGGVKLIDFGIAKAANRATKTQVGTLKGKIGYLAPEQVLRKNVDHRADIFALGIVLYELTTATRAFRESSDLVTLERITNGDVKHPSTFMTGYPPELERIVLKALQIDPDERFQDAGSMGREIEGLAARLGITLGHAAIAQVMNQLFGGDLRRGRRRMARGSNEPVTEPSIQVVHPPEEDDEMTPIVDMPVAEPEVRSRSLKPTTPIRGDAEKPPKGTGSPDSSLASGPRDLSLEDLPTPIADPVMQVRAQHALIPLEDRPTPLAERVLAENGIPLRPSPTPAETARIKTPPPEISKSARVLTPAPGDVHVITPVPDRPMTPVPGTLRKTLPLPARNAPPPPPRIAQHTPPRAQLGIDTPPRMPTGPQLPVVIFHDLADAPTHITGTRVERDDPTDLPTNITPQMLQLPPPRVRTDTGEIVKPRSWAPSTWNRVVQRVHPEGSSAVRTWILLCVLFAIAVTTTIVIALL